MTATATIQTTTTRTKNPRHGHAIKKIVQEQKNARELAVPSTKKPDTPYTPELADQIINRLADGETLIRITRDDGMPHTSAIHQWISTYPDFAERYQKARQHAATSLVEQMMEEVAAEERPEQVGLTRLKMETKRWVASKFNPQAFGDTRKIDITGEIKHTHSLSLTEEQKKRIAQEWMMADNNKKEPILITGTAETTGPDKEKPKKAKRN